MTVAKLKAHLNTFDDELPVYVSFIIENQAEYNQCEIAVTEELILPRWAGDRDKENPDMIETVKPFKALVLR